MKDRAIIAVYNVNVAKYLFICEGIGDSEQRCQAVKDVHVAELLSYKLSLATGI